MNFYEIQFLEDLEVNNKKLHQKAMKSYDKNYGWIDWEKLGVYEIFLNLLDEKDSMDIKYYDEKITKLKKQISKGTKVGDSTGWCISTSGAIMKANFVNMDIPEARDWDTWRIHRDNKGFFVVLENCDFFTKTEKESKEFLDEHIDEFQKLHEMYQKRYELYLNFKVKKGVDIEYAKLIRSVLGLDFNYIYDRTFYKGQKIYPSDDTLITESLDNEEAKFENEKIYSKKIGNICVEYN